MNSFKTSQFLVFFDDAKIKSIVISRLDNLAYEDAYSIAEIDSICARYFDESSMTNEERIKIISKSVRFFYL